jgi:hypothetical protein
VLAAQSAGSGYSDLQSHGIGLLGDAALAAA